MAQHYFGIFNTVPMHVLTLFFHVSVCLLVYHVCFQMGMDRLQSFLSSLYMLVSQTNVMAVSGNDTLSQILVTFFGCLSLWTIWKATSAGPAVYKSNALFAISLAFFILCLLSKETAVSFFLQALAILAFSGAQRKIPAFRLIIWGSAFSLAVVAYWILHTSLPLRNASFGYGPYNVYPGLNVLANSMQFFCSLLSPLSTVDMFKAFFYKNMAFLIFSALSLGMVSALCIWGIVKSEHRKNVLWVVVLGAAGFFPLVIVRHVSELYTYQFAPFFSIAAGTAFGHLLKSADKKVVTVFTLIIIFAIYASGIFNVEKKIIAMKKNGDQAQELISQLVSPIKNAPQDAYVYLVNPQKKGPEYSMFMFNGFNVLEYGLLPICHLLQRDDVAVAIVDPPVSKTCGCNKHFYDTPVNGSPLLLTLDENRVIPYIRRGH
jgi:hypothetical protein